MNLLMKIIQVKNMIKQSFKLTIVTAAWNAENLPRVFETTNKQTFKDWQHIIVNDNNPEVRECMEALPDNPQRHWIDFRVRTHYYGALARNAGVMAAFSYMHHSQRDIENEWIVFLDDDNSWEPDHLQSMIDAVSFNPDAVMVASDAVWIGRDDKTFREVKECKLGHGRCDLGQFMYKTTLFRKYGFFDPHPRAKHKYDWNLLRKMFAGEPFEKIHFTDKPTFLMNYKKR